MNDIDPVTAADHAPPVLDFFRTPLIKQAPKGAPDWMARSIVGQGDASDPLYGVTYDEIIKALVFAAESKGLTAKQFVCNNLAAAFEAENDAARRPEWHVAQLRELHKKNAALTKVIGRYSLIIRNIDSMNAAIARLHADDNVPAAVKREIRHKSLRIEPTQFVAGIKASVAHALCTARLERNAVQDEIKRVRGAK